MKGKKNIWKSLTIILLILVLILSFIYIKTSKYEFTNGLKLKKSTVHDIEKNIGSPFKLCNSNNQCMIIGDLNNIKE